MSAGLVDNDLGATLAGAITNSTRSEAKSHILIILHNCKERRKNSLKYPATLLAAVCGREPISYYVLDMRLTGYIYTYMVAMGESPILQGAALPSPCRLIEI